MSRHLADHRSPSDGSRLRNFMRLARDRSERLWDEVRRKPRAHAEQSRRATEFTRIERGRET